MVRKKNKMFVDSADRTPHYSLRKLSVGVASVLLSTTLWMGANGSVAHADTINGATVAVKAENKSDASETPMASKQTQTAESTSQGAEKQNGEAQNGQVQEGSRANAGVQTATANDAHAQAGMTKQEPAAPSQQTASQAKVSAPASAEEQASTAEDAKNKSTTLDVSQASKTSTAAALNKKMFMASLAGTASAGSKSKSDDLKSDETKITSLINQAQKDGLTVTKGDAKTYTIKKEALNDLDKQVADIQGKVTRYEADLAKWQETAKNSSDPKDFSQRLSFANEHDASLEVTSESNEPVNFINSSAWLGKDREGVYADGITTGGNISKSFSDSDISHSQKKGTGEDIKKWGNTYTGIQLKVGKSVVASYTGLKNSVYIGKTGAIDKDKTGTVHKLSKVQVKYTLNETTAKDGTANIFLSNNPNIGLWYGAAGDRGNGRVDLTVDLTFYDENGKEITLGKNSHAWLDMSSLNNGTTKVEYFVPYGNDPKYSNTTVAIPGSSITSHADGWYAEHNNEVNPAPAGWDNPTSANHYYGTAIMELEGNSFHIGQKITKYNPGLTNTHNVYSWFALDSSLAKPEIAWHEVTYGVTYDTKVDGEQTVTYVYKDKNGKVVKNKTKTVKQHTAFTGKTTKDEVTGETTTTWDQKDQKYTAVTTPVEPGYTADKKSVGGETVTWDDPNRSYTVVYTPNGSIVPVDPKGNQIPGTKPVPYETDPTDPTKVVDGKVPEVPKWTPKNGAPVKPSDPTKDTKVPYVHTKVVDGKVPEVPSWTPKNGNQGDPVKPSDPSKDTEVPDNHTMTPGETTATGKVEGLPEKPAKAPAEKLVKTPVKAPKAVKEASPAEMPAQKAAQAQDQLPQTGEDNSKAAFGLGLASILGGIGILGAFKRKKKEN